MKNLELVAPAGDYQKLEYAYRYGADACYVGMSAFSLRSKTTEFDAESVVRGRALAKKLKKFFFMTVNIYPRNSKIPAFIKHIKWLRDEVKPDALIAADAGVISIIKEVWPKARIHLSVQANNVNYRSVQFWRDQGVKRVILSRELNLEEVREIHKKVPDIELEYFVHGAICVAYSGRCLLSNYMSFRDSNQGACVQACRFKYKLLEEASYGPKVDLLNKKIVLEEEMRPREYMPISEDEHGTYIMNSRDLCMLPYLKEMADAGITSFKIEGRSKTVYYVASVCKIYRQAIEDLKAGRPFDESLMDEAYKIASRGYTPGFLFGDLGKNSMRYEKSSPIGGAKFVGIVGKEVSKGEYLVDVRNRVSTGEVLEVVLPDSVVSIKVKEFKDIKGNPLTEVHGGVGNRVFVLGKKGLEGGLLRING
ncbi:MAG: hypothetical protein UV80_C0004G0012 [Candidatus Peregrinibacteria bacterium GW2011_GWF2_43_17]|nr:MAG: hypothetical protein UV80_C0004G0012 [Candidatus Peregrinibacteria bacterium GW2011_GWF2_43_17]HAU39408.1 U32 family peptidase [Candidatus Peregrinibacteria bacterium]